MLILPPPSRRRADVLRGAASLARDDALGLAPATRHAEFAPHVRSAAFQQIDPVRIAREGQLQSEVAIVAIAMTINESLKCPHDLKVLPASNKGVR